MENKRFTEDEYSAIQRFKIHIDLIIVTAIIFGLLVLFIISWGICMKPIFWPDIKTLVQ